MLVLPFEQKEQHVICEDRILRRAKMIRKQKRRAGELDVPFQFRCPVAPDAFIQHRTASQHGSVTRSSTERLGDDHYCDRAPVKRPTPDRRLT